MEFNSDPEAKSTGAGPRTRILAMFLVSILLVPRSRVIISALVIELVRPLFQTKHEQPAVATGKKTVQDHGDPKRILRNIHPFPISNVDTVFSSSFLECFSTGFRHDDPWVPLVKLFHRRKKVCNKEPGAKGSSSGEKKQKSKYPFP